MDRNQNKELKNNEEKQNKEENIQWGAFENIKG